VFRCFLLEVGDDTIHDGPDDDDDDVDDKVRNKMLVMNEDEQRKNCGSNSWFVVVRQSRFFSTHDS
jgi:hypothetical protein